MNLKVKITNEGIELPKNLIEAADGDELVARIFFNRGYKNPEIVRKMLHMDQYKPTMPQEFPGMDKAIQRIDDAIRRGEKICIYGDYDVDGVTSTALLVEGLSGCGAQISYHVPDRFTEGYGMNKEVIRELSKRGTNLIITCDCGISNIEEVGLAMELGMDVIVTDHHKIGSELPKAHACINPKLLPEGHPARNLSGCATAFFVMKALYQKNGVTGKEDEFLDLVALSLIADVVSLNGENRYLLQNAMPKLFETERIGLKALFEVIERNGKMSNEEDIGFQIAPRINAAGRMESARLPVELLISQDFDEALLQAEKIDLLNQERKRVQQTIVAEAEELVEQNKKNQTILVLYNEHWHHGIIGIAAGKICEKYQKPTILLSMKEDGETVVGSARSIEGVDIYEILKANSRHLLKFGGHTLAAGLSLKKANVSEFIKETQESARQKYFIKDEIVVEADFKLTIAEMTDELFEKLERCGPYGEGFEAPVFYTEKAGVISDRKVKNNHHIMVLTDDGEARIPAVKWFGEDADLTGRTNDIVYKLRRNQFRGKDELQITIEYFLESEDKKFECFAGEIIDDRHLNIDECLINRSNAVYYFEGFESVAPKGVKLINRECGESGETLVLLSPPVNTEILREVVAKVNPKNIVLNFGLVPDVTFGGFITKLAGLVKHVVNTRMYGISIEYFSIKLCSEESIVFVGLKLLKENGKISFIEDNELLYFSDAVSGSKNNTFLIEKRVKAALIEKQAYFEFLKKINPADFIKYVK